MITLIPIAIASNSNYYNKQVHVVFVLPSPFLCVCMHALALNKKRKTDEQEELQLYVHKKACCNFIYSNQ